MISPQHGAPKYWVTETIDSPAQPNVIQFVLVAARRGDDEPFPGLTNEILKFVQSDAVSHVHSCVTDKTRKAVNVILAPTEEPHASVPE